MPHWSTIRLTSGAVLVASIQTACSSPQERFLDLCRERRQMINALYVTYGGNQLLQEAGVGSAGWAAGVRSADYDQFEDACQEVGRGGRPFFITAKAEAFFGRPEVVETCGSAVNLEIEALALQGDDGTGQRIQCP